MLDSFIYLQIFIFHRHTIKIINLSLCIFVTALQKIPFTIDDKYIKVLLL